MSVLEFNINRIFPIGLMKANRAKHAVKRLWVWFAARDVCSPLTLNVSARAKVKGVNFSTEDALFFHLWSLTPSYSPCNLCSNVSYWGTLSAASWRWKIKWLYSLTIFGVMAGKSALGFRVHTTLSVSQFRNSDNFSTAHRTAP